MHVVASIVGVVFCLGVMLDAFQTIILPRRPSGRLRITRLFYIATWQPWVAVAERMRSRPAREQMYSIFGPVSLLFLLIVWAVLLVVGFGLIYFSLGTPFNDQMTTGRSFLAQMRTDLYVSGTTLFTLGLGDVTPRTLFARAMLVFESGTGLGFVALVIGYVPVLYGAFSKREVSVALLDARAGSPPTAAELLQRHSFDGGPKALSDLLEEWERWSAEILESHISYPILCYYRSQHDNQSWLSALTAILDACALLITTVDGPASRQAELTFVMARHALVDLGHVFHIEGRGTDTFEEDRLTDEAFGELCNAMGKVSLHLCADSSSKQRLLTIRGLYEPHAQALAAYLKMPLPNWISPPRDTDQWRKVSRLRSGTETVLVGSHHISSFATSAHLHDEEHGF